MQHEQRVTSYAAMLAMIATLLLLSKLEIVMHLAESLVLIISLGLLYDFGPRLMNFIVNRLEKGTAGIIGFLLFAFGFILQAYISLSSLY